MKLSIVAAFLIAIVVAGCAEEPGQAAFMAADEKLDSDNSGSAFGNGPAAETLATRFNARLELIRKIAFTKNPAGNASADQAFVTYCHMTDTSVMFLITVPELRNFGESAQASLLEMSWATARELTKSIRPEQDLSLGIGLRGRGFYGGYALGNRQQLVAEDRRTTGVIAPSRFYPFFVGAYPASAALEAALPPAAPKD
jgi:hypothetical protein